MLRDDNIESKVEQIQEIYNYANDIDVLRALGADSLYIAAKDPNG